MYFLKIDKSRVLLPAPRPIARPAAPTLRQAPVILCSLPSQTVSVQMHCQLHSVALPLSTFSSNCPLWKVSARPHDFQEAGPCGLRLRPQTRGRCFLQRSGCPGLTGKRTLDLVHFIFLPCNLKGTWTSPPMWLLTPFVLKRVVLWFICSYCLCKWPE